MTVTRDECMSKAYRQRIRALHDELGIPLDYESRYPGCLYVEAQTLLEAGPDYYGRPQQLEPAALQAWQSMQAAAEADRIVLHLISAYRSIDYQCELIRRKCASGRSLDDILIVNAAPGYSEHHTGRAIDVGTLDCPALVEAFEETPAFAWLQRHAADFGFKLSYPRGNPSGIAYEPWHWCFQAMQ